MINKILNNKYYIEEQIAQGGFCSVYKGFDLHEKYFQNDISYVAIKIPNDYLMSKIDINAYIYAEYTLLKNLSSENIVKVLDFGIDVDSNKPYFILEYLNGNLLSESFSLPIKRKNKIVKNLFKTILYIHSKGIVHGDISPSNIMIIEDNPVIFDFGNSQSIHKTISFDYKKNIAFTPNYSDYTILNSEKPSFYSDIFSLVSVIFEFYINKNLQNENDFFNSIKRPIPFITRLLINKVLISKNQNEYPNFKYLKLLNYLQ